MKEEITLDIYKLIGVGLITAISVLIVKQVKPDIAIVIGLTGGILLVIMMVDSLTQIISIFNNILLKSNLSQSLFNSLLKIIGIGYLTEFSANLCVDAGSANIADKILLGGKLLILVVALPIITNLLDIIVGILP